MTDMSTWERLSGGPCDGREVWVEPLCWAVVATRDSDRTDWFMQMIEVGEESPILVANEAHLYLRAPSKGFAHTPHGLQRDFRHGMTVWGLKPEGP